GLLRLLARLVPQEADDLGLGVDVVPGQAAQLARATAGEPQEQEHLAEAGRWTRPLSPPLLAGVDLARPLPLHPDRGVAEERLERLLGVPRLVEGQVAVDYVGDAETASLGVVLRALEDLLELLLGRVEVGVGLLPLEQDDAAALDGGGVGFLFGEIPGMCSAA